MTSSHRLELAAEARANVARVLTLLERPDVETLDSSTAELAGAIALMEQVKKEGSEGGAPLQSILNGLRRDLRRAGSMLRHAWEFRVLAGGQTGYTRKGKLALQERSTGRWSLEA
jgi:hypothetical protein